MQKGAPMEENLRFCPLCDCRSLSDDETYCPRCIAALDALFPGREWRAMETDDLREHLLNADAMPGDEEDEVTQGEYSEPDQPVASPDVRQKKTRSAKKTEEHCMGSAGSR